jgi:chorismate mutase
VFNKVTINEEETIRRYGYLPKENNRDGNKMCVVKCTHCSKLIDRQFSNKDSMHSCPIIDGQNKKCFKCKTWKDYSLFVKNKKGSGGVGKLCRECYNNYDCVKLADKRKNERLKSSFTNDLNLYLSKRESQIKHQAKYRGHEYDLDVEYVRELWDTQNGKCYYTGLDMIADGRVNGFQGWNCPSFDRKSPELGYVKGNVVWCCFAVNSFKQSLSESEFGEKIKSITWPFLNKSNL